MPSWVSDWLAARDVRAAAAVDRATKTAEVDPAAQARRAEARERKIAAGLDEFDRWLRDLMRRGLVSAKGEGYAFWDAAGARLVDAQASALGRSVRNFAAIANAGPAWGERALEHAARLHLVVEGYRRIEALPTALRDDIRALVGWTVKEDEVLDGDVVTDRWLALGRTVTIDERLTTARTWLLGEVTGRWALHLAFAPTGAPPPIALTGGSLVGAVVFYPSAAPLRAVVRDGAVAGSSVSGVPHGVSIGGAAVAFAQRLANDPYLETWPTVLAGVVPLGDDGRLLLRDPAGAQVAVAPRSVAARLLALAGGEPVTVVGLWSGRSLQVLSVLADGRLVDMAAESGGTGDHAPAISGEPEWERLVSTALLGTERLGDDRSHLEGVPSGAELATRDPETGLLAAAGIAALRRRAGWVAPVSDQALPTPAAADPRPVLGPAAAWQLRRILDEQPDLLGEWLQLAALTSRRPPDEELPRLLAVAARNPAMRTALVPLLGPRATWLVTQLPELAAGLGAGEDPAAAFEAATSPEARADAIVALRTTDAERARDLVEGAWESVGPEDRARMLGALGVGLGAQDERLLERGRADKRAEVRVAAADLLARLPDSDFSRLATTTARPLLAAGGRFRPRLAVSLPTWGPALEGLLVGKKPPQGLGERAWWLRQLIERVDPRHWETWLAVDADALVEQALRADDARPVLEGWVAAALRFGDARWAASLLGSADVASGKAAPGTDVLGLLDVLDPRAREATVIRLMKEADPETIARLVAACPRPWSNELARASLGVLAQESATDYPTPGFYDHLRIAVRRIPPSFADELESAVYVDDRRRRSNPITDAVDILRSRHQLAQAFDHEPKESR